jgi:uncharacterized protein (AIM24 family)
MQPHRIGAITQNQTTVNVYNGELVSINSGVEVENLYIHGGHAIIKGHGIVRNCIVNSGTLELNTGADLSQVLVKKDSELIVHSDVKVRGFTSTGSIRLQLFKGAAIKS